MASVVSSKSNERRSNMSGFTVALPAMHLVCNIVVSKVPRVVQNNSDIAVNESWFTPHDLPSGYIVYPNVSASYKVFDEQVTWDVANERCKRDNADLATIDSVLKIELIKKQMPLHRGHRSVGIRLRNGNDSVWISVKTGLPVASMPWGGSEPTGPGRCVMIRHFDNGLGRYHCDAKPASYVCELPVPDSYQN